MLCNDMPPVCKQCLGELLLTYQTANFCVLFAKHHLGELLATFQTADYCVLFAKFLALA